MAAAGKIQILIVDDQRNMRTTLGILLRGAGYATAEAADGDQVGVAAGVGLAGRGVEGAARRRGEDRGEHRRGRMRGEEALGPRRQCRLQLLVADVLLVAAPPVAPTTPEGAGLAPLPATENGNTRPPPVATTAPSTHTETAQLARQIQLGAVALRLLSPAAVAALLHEPDA